MLPKSGEEGSTIIIEQHFGYIKINTQLETKEIVPFRLETIKRKIFK